MSDREKFLPSNDHPDEAADLLEEYRSCLKCNGEGKRKSFFPGEPKRECVF